MNYAFASLLLHAGHGMPAGHVHAWDVVAMGAVAIGLILFDWHTVRRDK